MDDLAKNLTILLALAALLQHVSAEIPRQEIDSATAALRSRGYSLFGNSITVSDILFEVISGSDFTFLSPPDTSLFSLAMSTDSFRYVHSLRLHVIPRRLTLADLRNLSLSRTPSVDSLVPANSIFVANRRREFNSGDRHGPASDAAATALDYVVVNGVRISSPDIYLGPHIAVHGLDGTLAADMLPPETFHGDLGLGLVPPPAWSPSERFPPSPSIEAFSPAFQEIPILPHPDLPPPTPRVPSPKSEMFASSPKSAHPAFGSPAPHSPPPPPTGNSGGTGQTGSSFRPIDPIPSSPFAKTNPPRQAPFSPPQNWGTKPSQTHPKGRKKDHKKDYKKDHSHPWEKRKKSHESTKHRKSKKQKEKNKYRKQHHHEHHHHDSNDKGL